jgi:hypothetical protein
MTPREFVIWLQGFVAATHEYSMTPKQWDEFKDKLQTVVLDGKISYTITPDTYCDSSDKTLLKD